jgi:2-polyprenyl-6-methoxyphenol hydroxylase-like FAD-dependent oxidoreductase
MADKHLTADCAIAGGGPAGMMLGLLLARAGIDVVVLEKHSDFLRDFRGDTLHPSTLEVMHELGLFEELESLPHQKVERLSAQFGDWEAEVADFSHLPVRSRYIMLMPQWDFLDFLKRQGERYSIFRCLMSTPATGLIIEGDRVKGLCAEAQDGLIELRAPLVVAADGRGSTMREAGQLEVRDLGAPIDVLWFRLSRKDTDTDQTGGRFDQGRLFIRIYRGDYWQCAYVIAKGSADKVHARGIEAFQEDVAKLVPFEAARANELTSFDDISLLSVSVDRLKQWWRPGLLCIGDAAHAMSPVGGVGINLAIQDAVAAANILADPLSRNALSDDDLAAVEKRRLFATRLTQRAQIFVHDRVLGPLLSGQNGPVKAPMPVRLLQRFPLLRRIPARLVGMGVRPEHIRSPLIKAGRGTSLPASR